jgi:hypothetical protein
MNTLRKIATSVAMFALAGVAQAAPLEYVLDNVVWGSPFGTPGVIGVDFLGQCPGCVGGSGPLSTAVVDGSNVSLTDIAFGLGNASSNYLLTVDSATTILGTGVALIKNGVTCVAIAGSACNPASTRSALGFAVDFTGQAADGSLCAACGVNVILSADEKELSVRILKQLTQGSASQQFYQLNYTLIPVPGAVWLLGSALGLAGFLRRRTAA